jgi:DNA-binding protein YbaB
MGHSQSVCAGARSDAKQDERYGCGSGGCDPVGDEQKTPRKYPPGCQSAGRPVSDTQPHHELKKMAKEMREMKEKLHSLQEENGSLREKAEQLQEENRQLELMGSGQVRHVMNSREPSRDMSFDPSISAISEWQRMEVVEEFYREIERSRLQQPSLEEMCKGCEGEETGEASHVISKKERKDKKDKKEKKEKREKRKLIKPRDPEVFLTPRIDPNAPAH